MSSTQPPNFYLLNLTHLVLKSEKLLNRECFIVRGVERCLLDFPFFRDKVLGGLHQSLTDLTDTDRAFTLWQFRVSHAPCL